MSDRKTRNFLCGVNEKNNVLILIVYICVFVMMGCIWGLSQLKTLSNSFEIILFSLVAFLLFLAALLLQIRNRKHRKELTEKYNALSAEEKEEVLRLARTYDGSGLKVSEHFLYGFMARVNEHKQATDMIVFEYLPLSQIASIDTLRSREQEAIEAELQRKTQAALISASVAYRRNRTGVSTIYSMPTYA